MRVIWQCTKKQFKEGWLKTLVNTHNMQITDGTIPGLSLRYYAGTNRISFYLAYRSAMTRKHRNILVGKYSDFKLEEIKDRAIKIRQMLATGIDPIEEQVKQKKKKEEELATRVTVDQVFEEYMEKYSKIYKKPSTQYSDGKEYKGYIQPRFGSMYIRDIEEKHIVDAYTEWAKATSFSTANKTLSLFSSMWDWSETYKYVPRDCNPCRHVKKGSNEKFKATVLDIDGYRRLFKALDDGMNHPGKHARMFRALKLLALTGCRCSEITDLELDEVALEEKRIHLKDSKTGARDIKLSDAAVAELEIAIKEAKKAKSDKYVFPGVLDKTKPISNVTKPFNWALEQAGLPHMRIHDLRHSFITMGANLGENMNAMKDAAGHTKLTTTEMYTHAADKNTFAAVNNIAAAIYE